MKYSRRGKNTYPVSVGAVTPRGFWLLLGTRKVFVSYRAFPWFAEFTVKELARVRRPAPDHIRWAEFDIELELASLERPERYPVIEKRLRGNPATVMERLRSERKRAGH